VLTTYDNSLTVAVNSNKDQNWAVTAGSRSLVLPPFGWAAWDNQNFLEYSARFDGNRRDFVGSAAYVYFDGRGHAGQEGGIESAGQVIAFRSEGAMRVIPVQPAVPLRLNLAALSLSRASEIRLTYVTEAGEMISEGTVLWPADGHLSPQFPPRAFAVKLETTGR
jgi:hypothetical protein